MENFADEVKSVTNKFQIGADLLAEFGSKSDEVLSFLKVLDQYIKSSEQKDELTKQELSTLRKQRLNAEHQLSQIEKQLISCNSALQKETQDSDQTKKRLEETEKQLSEKEIAIRKLEKERESTIDSNERAVKKASQLENEKEELLEVLEKKNKEVERLNDEWKSISAKFADANKAKFDAEAKVDEIQSRDITREFKEKRLEQEKELLSRENEQLRSDLESKTSELVSLKKDKTSQLLNLKGTEEQQEQEIKQMKTQLENYKKSNADQEEKVNSLIQKLNKAREDYTDMESYTQKELSAKTKLVNLYKESMDTEKVKVKEMTAAVEELQSLLKEAIEGKTAAESKLRVEEKQHEEIVKQLDEKVKKLTVEVENANELLEVTKKRGHQQSLSEEQLKEMSPTAAVASSLIKKGMTLTEIYSEYVQVSDALQSEKDENTRLKQYLDQILQEIEEKAPMLQQQRQNYEHALKTVDTLSAKFEEAMSECERYRAESEEASRKTDYQKRENNRLNNLCADLSQQVRFLLKECEEARGGVVSTDQEPPVISSTDVSSSAQIISEHLVSFKSIEECQAQNQKLLAVVRELSEEREKQEKERSTEKFDELMKKLDSATSQIEVLKDERHRQEEMIQTIARQRDMYKVLFNVEGDAESPFGKTASTPFSKSHPDVEALENDLKKAKAAENRVAEEYEEYKKKQTDKERSLQEKITSMEEELSSIRIENQRFKGQVEIAEEKRDSVTKQNEGLKREVEALIQKSRGLETAFSKTQKEAIFYKQELDGMKEKTIAAEVRARTTETEKKMIKDREERLLAENKSLLEQQRSRNVLLTNLQSIQNNLERQEFETRRKLGSQVDNLQRELKALRRKLDTETDTQQKATKAYEERSKHLRTQLELEKKTKAELQRECEDMKKEFDPLKLKVSELDEQLKASETRFTSLLESVEKEKDDQAKKMDEKYQINAKSLERRLEEANSRIKALQSKLENANKHLAQFKEMAAVNEKALQSTNKEKEDVNQRLNVLQRRYTEASKQLESTRNELKQRKTDAERRERELQSTIDEVKGSLSVVQGEVEGARRAMKSAQESEAAAKAEAQEQLRISDETQVKYERELVLHAKDVEALVKAKEQLHEYVSLVDNTESQVQEAQEKLEATEKDMETMRKHHEEEKKKLQTNYKQISEQNSLLHKEIEKLSAQLKEAKAKKPPEIKQTAQQTEVPAEGESAEDLREVIRYIRREKDIAETKSEAALSESLRYKQRCEHLEKDLDETRAALDIERKRTQGQMLSKDEHADIKSKIAKVNELTQLKEQLERQKENVEKANKTLQEKNKQLESNLASLRQSKKQLEDEKGGLVAEKTALKGEIQRWTQRTQQLIEQSSNKADAEELKKVQEEFKKLQDEHKKLEDAKILNDRSVAALKDEIQRGKTLKETMQKEMLKLKNDLAENQNKTKHLQSIVDNAKTEREDMENKLNQEIETLKNDRDEKEGTINERNEMITKLKKLAKKYKTQCEEQQQQQQQQEQAGKKTEAPVEGNSEALEKSQVELGETKKQLEELKNDFEESLQRIAELEKSLSESKEEIQNVTKENEKNKTALTEKDEKNKKVLRSVKEKITLLTAQKDKGASETEELKKSNKDITDKLRSSEQILQEKEMRLTVLKTQFDSKITRLERELQEAKDKVQSLTENNQKLEQNLKDAENSAKQAKATAAASEVLLMAKVRAQAVTKPVQEAATVEPLTATVRPTSSSVTNQTQKTMASRTASIRPLIPSTPTAMVSPTVPPTQQQTTTQVVTPQVAPVVALPTSTSTATVPTEHRPQMAEVAPGPSRNQPAAVFKAPMVRVSAQVQEEGGSSEARVEPVSATSSEAADAERNDLSDEPDETLQAQEVAAAVSMLDDETEEPSGQEDQGSRIGHQNVPRRRPSDTSAGKRRRSLEEADTEQTEHGAQDGVKRARVQEETEQSVAADSSQATPPAVLILSDDDEVDEDDDEELYESVQVEQQPYFDQEYDDEDEGEEGDEEIEELEEEENEDELDEEGEEAEGIEEEEEELDDVEQEDDDSQEEIDEEEDDGADEADEEEEEEEETPGDAGSQNQQLLTREPAREQQPSRRQPSPAAAMLMAQEQGGRGRFLRTRYQLPSFSLPPGQGGGGPFDEADDSIVPSTPTLFVPKRTDGFAEAVSSPQVRYPVFSFSDPSQGSNQGSALEGNMNDEGLRLDETRIDLLAGEDPASVPRTPLSVVPSVTITQSGPDEDDNVLVSRPSEGSLSTSGSIRSSRLSESAVAVPRISNSGSEDIGQEQNVPQQIDLTGDDDEGDRIDDVEGAMDEEDVVEMAADEDDDLLQEESSQDPEEPVNQGEEIEEEEELEQIEGKVDDPKEESEGVAQEEIGQKESQEEQRSDKDESRPPGMN